MATITKIDLIHALSERLSVNLKTSTESVDAFIAEIEKAISVGNRVELRGFGIWDVRVCKARIGRNPADPTAGPVEIPARCVVHFKAGKNLKTAVAKNPVT